MVDENAARATEYPAVLSMAYEAQARRIELDEIYVEDVESCTYNGHADPVKPRASFFRVSLRYRIDKQWYTWSGVAEKIEQIAERWLVELDKQITIVRGDG
jgi:hypothetical protein